MRRIVIVSDGPAGAKAAARIKRMDSDIEVNLVVSEERPSEEGGPFALLTNGRRVSRGLMEVKQVGLIEASDVSIDFEGKELIASTDRGSLPVRYTDLVLEIDATPRLPRAAARANNVVPWPVKDGGLVDAMLDETEPESAVVVGGLHALPVLAPLLEKGIAVLWLRTSNDGLDKELWQTVEAMVEDFGDEALTVADWTDVRPEALVPVVDDSGNMIAVESGGGERAEGEVFFWAESLRAIHPVIAQEGVEIDESGFIAVGQNWQSGRENVYCIGSGVAAQRAPFGKDGKYAAPKTCSEEATVGMGRSVADCLTGKPSGWAGEPLALQADVPGGVVMRAGLTLAEAAEAGYEPEFAILRDRPALAMDDEFAVVKCICDKESRVLLGVQLVATEESIWAEGAWAAATMALAAGMTVDRIATVGLAGGAELIARAAGMIVNKLQYRIWGITPDELLASKEAGSSFFMLDLRDQPAWKAGHIEDAYNIPYPQLKKRLQEEVPRMTALLIIARTSDIAYNVACMLAGLGATDLYVLDGGMEMWPYELVTGDGATTKHKPLRVSPIMGCGC